MSNRVAIIASHGGVETAYKVMNIAMAGIASDAEVQIFFTFDGLDIIRNDAADRLKLAPGNAGLSEGFKKANVPPITDMIQMAQESGVRLIACQMTMDVMSLTKEDFIDGVDFAGAMTFLDFAYDANVSLTF
ncbi:DsrE/DsrF/DrsH-like family protein [Alicyclobacillus mengziensis]|uniref:DsrE/DsrF/DrsH-like family protein n=1 Tax=Alicyclobacillus mengziensis TaxID=2931921 RepID=A0A9X7W0L5_9BACL|nr:DsrE/DsrF/DrsH-like family protein [Alicyclobacillus mengziensis]QSO48521.1 DsrE/DsrF/DrsH-like family protein [Alicyclobacillus mengziensis]